ncbi:MAG: hypothetical protein AUJ23_04105 [Candidatus Magasanikbacteria bacterium CG1_02_32_51]|uniref:Shikimate kinase n=1 Tax=Candidatus Magasanikbacteria bacterium CG1_02_32_51 TaxID=1805238 RepID=A0A1J4U7P2_9BACT|nr:MAG: hypothetical protein AUJ23_04105 [Candidatus Magasanikbacteria bacterium CG1_02_32_51]
MNKNIKFIVIYGPPGVGKLTVSKELTKITKYSLFHNHLTFDAVAAFFVPGSEDFLNHLEKIRLYLIKVALKTETRGIIFTGVYRGKSTRSKLDERFFRKVRKLVERVNGNMYFVRLFCDQKILEERIKNEDRKQYKKVHRKKTLRNMQSKYDLAKNIPGVKSLSIDNSKITPKATAKKIKQAYSL